MVSATISHWSIEAERSEVSRNGLNNSKAEDDLPEALQQEICRRGPASFISTKRVGMTTSLRQRVETLLGAHRRGRELSREARCRALAPTLDQPITEKPGTQIGPYKLLQQLGEGGMGVVYMAEQKEPVKRRVALKIIKPGMDTRQVIARFEAERQALAMMDHPNIAKVLDAGQTESGRPYFVMELVNGVPVTQYCDEQHLTPKERLELFVPDLPGSAARASEGHHPSRSQAVATFWSRCTTTKPVPKIIDFGVAKATSQTLTEKTMFTQLGQVVGTLEYMSSGAGRAESAGHRHPQRHLFAGRRAVRVAHG